MKTKKYFKLFACWVLLLSIFSCQDQMDLTQNENNAIRNSSNSIGDVGNNSQVNPVFNTVYVGGYDNQLHAFDAGTGKQRWSAMTGGVIFSSPTLANGQVFVSSQDGNTYAFDASTGAMNWSTMTYGELSSPTVFSDRLIVAGYTNQESSFGLHALDLTTGKIIWSSGAPNLNFPISSPTVATVDNSTLVYITSDDLYAFDFFTGQLVWKAAAAGTGLSSPAVADGVVYVGGGDFNLYAFDAATGALLWKSPTGFSIFSSPTISNGKVFVGSYDYKMYAFDARTGVQVWSFTTGDVILSSPIVSGNLVYFASYDHYLYSLDAATGNFVWRTQTSSYYSSPTVVSGTVFIGGQDSNYKATFYALDALTGAVQWTEQINGQVIYSSPAVLTSNRDVYHPGISGEQQ